MSGETEQGPFEAPESSVDAASTAIAALLQQTPNPGNDEEDGPTPAPVTAQTKPEAKAAQPETKAVEAADETETETTTTEQETTDEPETAERKTAPKAAQEAPEDKAESKPNPDEEFLTQLNTLVPRLRATIEAEFEDVKSMSDLTKIGQEDPARYNRFVILRDQLMSAQAEQGRLAVGSHNRWAQVEAAKLAKAIPDFADPVKGVALRNELRQFALKQGHSEDELQPSMGRRGPSAAQILTLYKAMQYDKYQAAQKAKPAEIAAQIATAKEKAAKAPAVQKPGAQRDDSRADKANEDYKRLQKTGRVEDAAKLFQHILG